MKTLTAIHDMQAWSATQRDAGKRIGFVPTMGYLHAGHLSLVEIARRRAGLVVASIFVNPTQFGAGEDLDRYPRDLDGDTKKLAAAGTDVLFLPDAAEMYPHGHQTRVNVEGITRGLCGGSRPTHFSGVTTIVCKLFNIVQPHLAVFGEKDFQQLATIRRMVLDLNFAVEIVGGAIVREPDGVAMSSRNAYLAPAERKAALCLNRALQAAQSAVEQGTTDGLRIVAAARQIINAEELARVDYASLVDEKSLQEIDTLEQPAVLAIAVYIGKTRLIDNIRLTPQQAALFGAASQGNQASLNAGDKS